MNTEERKIEKIVVCYDNGGTKEIKNEKAAVIGIGNVKEDGTMDITFDMINIERKDLQLLVLCVTEFAGHTGMFEESEVEDE